MRLVFLGLPGAGKGTQARLLSEALAVPQVSTGDMLRQAMAEGSELGRQARGFVESGRLVPDDLVLGLIEQRLGGPDSAAGFILDGFPRTVEQARGLDALLERMGAGLDRAVLIELDPAVLVQRLGRRRSCPGCGAIFNLDANPPRREGVCDDCGSALAVRADDQPEKVALRIEVYRKETEPLIRYYDAKGLLARVRGDGDIARIQADIRRALAGEKGAR